MSRERREVRAMTCVYWKMEMLAEVNIYYFCSTHNKRYLTVVSKVSTEEMRVEKPTVHKQARYELSLSASEPSIPFVLAIKEFTDP